MKWIKNICASVYIALSFRKKHDDLLTPIDKQRQEIIKAVQLKLGLQDDGIFGNKTLSALANKLGSNDNIFDIQRAVNITPNGIDDVKTWNAIEKKLFKEIKDKESEEELIHGISQKAYDLIVYYETGGEAYYTKKLQSPTYPGGASGITIGIGYDLGYNTEKQFEKDWKKRLSSVDYNSLKLALGLKGKLANNYLNVINPNLKNITISWNNAGSVFKTNTIPRFVDITKKAFPGYDKLSPDAFGALVSLVFNRGSSLKGYRRREMLNIHNKLKTAKAGDELNQYISDQILLMKRLWKGKGLDGLLTRRNAEAKLILA